MKKTNQLLYILLLIFLIITSPILLIQASWSFPITYEEMNIVTLMEATTLDLAFLALIVDEEPLNVFEGDATFNEDAWGWNLSSFYNSQSINLNYNGTLDKTTNTVNWSGSGSFATDPWITSGTAKFKANDEMDFKFDGQLGSSTDRYGGVAIFTYRFGGGKKGYWDMTYGAFYLNDEKGILLYSTGSYNRDTEEGFLYTRLKLPYTSVREWVTETELDDITKEDDGDYIGDTTTRISSIPEPSITILLGTCILGLGLAQRKRRIDIF